MSTNLPIQNKEGKNIGPEDYTYHQDGTPIFINDGERLHTGERSEIQAGKPCRILFLKDSIVLKET